MVLLWRLLVLRVLCWPAESEEISMTSTEILNYGHQQIIDESRARRLAAERRHAVPDCGYGCWDGWHEIALHEFGPLDLIPLPDLAVIVYPHIIVFACECRS